MSDDDKKVDEDSPVALDADQQDAAGRVVELAGSCNPPAPSEGDEDLCAAAWIVLFDDRSLTDQELSELVRWMRANDAHCRAFLRTLFCVRQNLILRRDRLPLLYGPGQGDDDIAVAELRARRWAEAIPKLKKMDEDIAADRARIRTARNSDPNPHKH